MRRISIIIFATFISSSIFSQEVWQVPAKDEQKLSPFTFNDDMKSEGQRIYENSCASCHGNPDSNNFAKLSPSPGDPATDKFQSQTDGALFYKIRKGRSAMPSFENVYGEEEVWSIISYFRDFNKNYIQKTDVSTAEKPVNLKATLSYNDNIYNLQVKVLVDSLPEEGIKVAAFVKGNFGMYALPKATTNKAGIAYVPVDNDLPSNSQGNLIFYVKVSKGSTTLKVTDTLLVNPEPVIKPAVTEGRHLWSTGKNAPIWLKFAFWGTVIVIWSAIVFIVLGLFGIKKLK